MALTSPSLHARAMIFGCLVVLLSFLAGSAQAADAAEWRRRSIYQVLTDRYAYGNGTDEDHAPNCEVELGLYCGGTWRGIMNNLDYIQGMNFDAIWISPVVKQLPQRTGDGEAYTAYWAQNLYELEPHFGTEQDLQDLVAALHSRGMLLMLDVVVNHMGFAGTGEDCDYSVLYPFNDTKYYHDYCEITDPTSPLNTQACWLGDWKVTLADLRTEDAEVQDMFGQWISQMVANYSIDGLRIDTSINVEPEFFPGFVDAAGVFATGEVMQGDDSLACQWADTIGSILNYPIYYTLTRAFSNSEGSINDLVLTIDSVKENCPNSTSFGSFSENHDVARFASLTDDLSLAKNIITYTMLADGIPIIYQGQEQRQYGSIHPYYNRAPLWQAGFNTSAPLYEHIAILNKFRQHVISGHNNYTEYMAEVIYQDMHSLGLRKGFNGSQVITVLNNNGQDCEYFELEVSGHDYAPGTVLTEVLTCTNLTVNDSGNLTVPMFAGTPKVLYPLELLANSGICGMHAAEEPLPSATIMTIDATSTVGGHVTTIETVETSPIPPITTHVWSTISGLPTVVPSVMNPEGGFTAITKLITTTQAPASQETAATTSTGDSADPSRKALGAGESLKPNSNLVLSAAGLAGAASNVDVAGAAASVTASAFDRWQSHGHGHGGHFHRRFGA
ncbi:alpha-amylase [Hortaea werneckii]|nr:alpha-amylase [Hortaea werneckii]KAI7325819.1 alpha-amylase [Hortaea werneckii]